MADKTGEERNPAAIRRYRLASDSVEAYIERVVNGTMHFSDEVLYCESACQAITSSYENSKYWVRWSCEPVYCVDSREVVYVKTDYDKNGLITCTLLPDKPTEIIKL